MNKKWINRKPKKVRTPASYCNVCGRKRIKHTLDGRCGRCRAKGIFNEEQTKEFERLRDENRLAIEAEIAEAKRIEKSMFYDHAKEMLRSSLSDDSILTLTLTNQSGEILWSATGLVSFQANTETPNELHLVICPLTSEKPK